MSESLIFAHILFFGEQCEQFPHNHSFPLSDVSKSLRSLTKNERCAGIAQFAHQKWATMSDSLTSLRGNERSWANRSGCSPKMSKWVNRSFFWANRSFTHFWPKNKGFAQKSNEQIPSPDWTPTNIPDQQKHVTFQKLQKRAKHSTLVPSSAKLLITSVQISFILGTMWPYW